MKHSSYLRRSAFAPWRWMAGMVAWGLLWSRLAVAGPPARPSPEDLAPRSPITYERFTLANGLQVYVMEDPRSPMVYEVMWVGVGSKDERPQRTGFAHLFEHLMFKGSAHVPDGELDRLLEEAGGWSNAFTSSDMTVYQNVASAQFLERVLWLEADRLAGLLDTFDRAKLDNQREVVINERLESYDNQPYGMAELLLQRNLWPPGHGYHWPVIGELQDLRRAQVADVKAFFREFYTPENLTLVIAGDVRRADVERLARRYLGWLPRRRSAPAPRAAPAAPRPIPREVRLNAEDRVQVPRVYLAWRGPAAFSTDEPALELALTLLGEGKTSRLYRRLVFEEKIAQDVSAGLAAEALGGTVTIEVTAKPGVEPRRLIDEITEEVAALAREAPDARALERAKNAHEAEFLAGLESTLARALALAQYAVLARDPDYFAKDLARYRRVTAAQLRAAAARYLGADARVVLTIAPTQGAAGGAE
ncbi:MAG: pitrilysin family protein [Kofleriaceae bacterium]